MLTDRPEPAANGRAADAYAAGTAYVAGRYVPIGEATIPLLDRGFTRSDATYDVAHVWKGWIFRLDDHLERFERNMRALRLSLPQTRPELREILLECVRRSRLDDAYVQITCTRGLHAPGSRDPRACVNQLYAYAIPFVWIADEEKQRRGLDLHVSAIHRIAPTSVDPTTKNFHWLDLTMGQFEALDAGRDTEVLTDAAGNVTEGPGFNLFLVKDGGLVTPDKGVFDGMTRRTVLDLAADLGLATETRDVPIAELRAADEAFLTSTAGGIMPVRAVDGVPLGAGRPGPVTTLLRNTYWRRKAEGWLGERVG